MKQEIATFLTTIKEELFSLSKYLYENPEPSFHEYKSYEYIVNMVKSYGFNITEHFLGIPTAFMASFGQGHPKICYLCEFDADEKSGHIYGNNLVSAMSVGATLALAKILPKTSGTVILIGCPGENMKGSKGTMVKQGVFNDIDLVLMAHPDVVTAESGTSAAVIPIKIDYTGDASYDAALLTLNGADCLAKQLKAGCSIDSSIYQKNTCTFFCQSDTEVRLHLRTKNLIEAQTLQNKIKTLVETIGAILEVKHDICLNELPCENLLTNKTLSRLFCHSLKESGIIEVGEPKDTNMGLSIGAVSKIVPCIHPYISIVENKSLYCPSPEFAAATLSPLAQDKMIKTAQALASTAFSLIDNENLLRECKTELANHK